MHTLAVSKKTVTYALEHSNLMGKFEPPQAGRKAANKTSVERENFVHAHICSFPCVEAHYCRASSTASYLNPDLSIAEMYRLYRKDFCVRKNIFDPVKKVFIADFL